MSDGDNEKNDQLPNKGKNDKPTRDARGRWLPGYCPNLKGRPRKKTWFEQYRDYSDLKMFGNDVVEVTHDGQKMYMDRRSALHCKLFESAMKGSVYAQRFLHKEFEKTDERLAYARVRYEQLIFPWIDAVHKSAGGNEIDFPLELELWLMQAETIFGHYSGGTSPTLVTDQYKIRQEGKKAERRGY